MDLMKVVESQFATDIQYPSFVPGDTITVYYKIKEGNKERTQHFKGVVIQKSGSGIKETFTIRKISGNVGVERIFPIYLPTIEKIEVNKKGKVRRAKLFYLRKAVGKQSKIKEKREIITE